MCNNCVERRGKLLANVGLDRVVDESSCYVSETTSSDRPVMTIRPVEDDQDDPQI